MILNELVMRNVLVSSNWQSGILVAELHTDMNVYATYQVISSPGIRTRAKMDWLVGSNFIGISLP
jgi:hypothetical protein